MADAPTDIKRLFNTVSVMRDYGNSLLDRKIRTPGTWDEITDQKGHAAKHLANVLQLKIAKLHKESKNSNNMNIDQFKR